MVSGYTSKYQINSGKKFDEFMFNKQSKSIVDHFRKLFKTQAGTDSVKKLCKKTMMGFAVRVILGALQPIYEAMDFKIE